MDLDLSESGELCRSSRNECPELGKHFISVADDNVFAQSAANVSLRTDSRSSESEDREAKRRLVQRRFSECLNCKG